MGYVDRLFPTAISMVYLKDVLVLFLSVQVIFNKLGSRIVLVTVSDHVLHSQYPHILKNVPILPRRL